VAQRVEGQDARFLNLFEEGKDEVSGDTKDFARAVISQRVQE
jgi:hypothetical protein